MAYIIKKGNDYYTGKDWSSNKKEAKKYPSVAKASSQVSYDTGLRMEKGLKVIKESTNSEVIIMENELDNAILAASQKDYSEFEKSMSSLVSQKMQKELGGFITHLEKNIFKEE